jgi:type IV pilus assembly protein PilB
LLLAAGTITQDELDRALALQKEQKGRLGEVLIANGIITEQQLIDALTEQLGIDYVDLTKVTIPTELAALVPKNIAKQYQVVPVRMKRDELYLAMSDPMNFYAIEEVRKASHKRIVPMVANAVSVERAIMVLYGNEGAARAIEEMRREFTQSGEVTEAASQAFTANELDDPANSAPTIRLVNSIVERAVTERASDIHLEPRETEMVVRMRIDGLMRQILTVPRDLQKSVISRFKIVSGLDIAETRVPQDGRFNIRVARKDIDLRVSTLPTVYGEKIVARLLDKTGGRVTKENIGLTGHDEEVFNRMLRLRSGVLLIVGPTGSGKSTTMYAMIGELNTPYVNLVTLEDPVEYNMEGVNQVQINEKTGLTFASCLRSILRQDPDIVGVGEIRDGETAEIAMRAAITGHVVISTIHTNDAVGTIERLIDIGVQPYLVSSALRGVVSQRLVRRICPYCRESYEPSDEELDDIGIARTKGLRFYRGAGCPKCYDTGYHGRIAVFEMLAINRNIRRMISQGCTRAEIEQELKNPENGFVSLRENALRLVFDGTTTASEVVRVISEDD